MNYDGVARLEPGEEFPCGVSRIRPHDNVQIEGQTCTGTESSGVAAVYRVTLPRQEYLDVAHIRWADGNRDVRALHVNSHSQYLSQLPFRRRLCLLPGPDGRRYAELRMARLKEVLLEIRPNLYSTSIGDLSKTIAVDVCATLKEAGALGVGLRADLIHDAGPRQAFPCATFPDGADLGPIVAYVLTRVLPIFYEVHQPVSQKPRTYWTPTPRVYQKVQKPKPARNQPPDPLPCLPLTLDAISRFGQNSGMR